MALNPAVILPTYHRFQQPAGDPTVNVTMPSSTVPSWIALLGIAAAGGLGFVAGGSARFEKLRLAGG